MRSVPPTGNSGSATVNGNQYMAWTLQLISYTS